MSSSGATESSIPISDGCGVGGGTTSSAINTKDEDADSNPFRVGEHVLAFHGPCLYDAKVSLFEILLFSEKKTQSVLLRWF